MKTAAGLSKFMDMLDAATSVASDRNGKMMLRRLLLDGVKILRPYRCALVSQCREPSDDRDKMLLEAKLMDAWISMAIRTALELKRSAASAETKQMSQGG